MTPSPNPTPPRLDAEELRRLRAIAEAAIEDWSAVQIGVGGGMRATETVPAYIAAFNPPTILALLDAQPAEGGSGDALTRTREELEEARRTAAMRGHEAYPAPYEQAQHWKARAVAAEAELSAAREALKGAEGALLEIRGLPELSPAADDRRADDFDRGARAARLEAADIAQAALSALRSAKGKEDGG